MVWDVHEGEVIALHNGKNWWASADSWIRLA
jgi:hypothetical protein